MNKYDVAIIGAGLAGLTTAFFARKAGMSVIIVDQGKASGGASGGLVGALAPHMPEHWSDKKQYQFDAMAMSPEFWHEIEELSGLKTGYQKLGRLQNIPDERGLEKALMRTEAAKISWGDAGAWNVCNDKNHPFVDTTFGYIHDTLSAQIMPRDAMIALAKAVEKLDAKVVEDFKVEDIEPNEIRGEYTINASYIVIAAGYASWPWARKYLGADFGEGTKGQAVLLKPRKSWKFPMVTGDGFYIVPHTPDLLAVGSTSERYWKHLSIDVNLEALLERVRTDIPTLEGAEILESWSGIRPRAFRPDPLIGKLENGILINSGGFKTGFSFAPKLAADLVKMLEGNTINVPPNFLPKIDM